MKPTGASLLHVQPTLQDVARAGEALQALLPAALQGAARHAVEVAFVEALTNIVQHGLGARPDGPIEVSCACEPGLLVLHVRDRGLPIPARRLDGSGPDPFAFDPDDVAALPENGLGLAILRAAFDRIDYRSDGGVNHLRLEKRIA